MLLEPDGAELSRERERSEPRASISPTCSPHILEIGAPNSRVYKEG